MKGFVPKNMQVFEISARGSEEFYEKITRVPTRVRGAWFTSNSEYKNIDFAVLDP